jgi:nickel transport protein
VYQLDQESESQGNGLDFAYVPMQEEVESAVSVLKRQGQQVQQFSGVPLFFARVGGSNQGMLTLEKNGEQFVPLFFEKEQLQQRVDQFKQAQPEEAESIEIGVTSLENVLATLQETNDEQYRQLVLYPSQESLQFLESVANNMSEPQ